MEISPVASLHMIPSKKRITKALIRLSGSAGWSAPMLFANPRVAAHLRAIRQLVKYIFSKHHNNRKHRKNHIVEDHTVLLFNKLC